MKIALDAKRAFYNTSGLGNYSRNLIEGFSKVISKSDELYLFTPKLKNNIYKTVFAENIKIVKSESLIRPYWRSFSVSKDIKKHKIDVYHGLSNEVPFSSKNLDVKTIVTIHDLLFLRFPHLYPVLDRNVYFHKAKKACSYSEKIVATSEATKVDLIEKLKVDESKIEVVYQSCAPLFYERVEANVQNQLKKQYKLPEKYFLYVGNIEKRKNVSLMIDAISKLPKKYQFPLVLVGSKSKHQKGLSKKAASLGVECLLFSTVPQEHLPYFYQNATLFLYLSFFEGFGIPVLEAMASKVPLITSKNTSMDEIVSDSTQTVNPYNVDEILNKIIEILEKDNSDIIEKNFQRSQDFSIEKFSSDIYKLYRQVL